MNDVVSTGSIIVFVISTLALLLFAVTDVIFAKLDRNTSTLIVIYYIIAFIAVDYIIKETNHRSYQHYRDHNYPDYSQSRDYQKWLIDHPKEVKNEI